MPKLAKTIVRAGLALALLGLGVGADAQQSGGVTIHGFGGWAAGYTDNANDFASVATEKGQLDNYNFALNLTAELKDGIEIHAQACWQSDIEGESVELDYIFAQYAFSSHAAIRVGKVKNPLGLYTEILDVGTLRPFYLVSQARYDGIPPSYLGIGGSGRIRSGRWELEVDAFVGQQGYNPIKTEFVVGVNPQTSAPIVASVEVLSEGRDMLGGRANLHTPIPGLMLGSSASTSRLYTGVVGQELAETVDKRLTRLSAHVEYLRDNLTFRSEYAHGSGRAEFDSFYAELGYKITPQLQVAGMYDWADRTRPDLLSFSQLTEHSAFGLGLNCWPDPRIAFKLDYYRIRGNLFARPASALDAAVSGTLEKTTSVVIVGTQFSF